MENKESCKFRMSKCEILGLILVIIATLLTVFSFSGLGILGMFIAGVAFMCHKHHRSKCCCNSKACQTSCDEECGNDVCTPEKPARKRATTAKE